MPFEASPAGMMQAMIKSGVTAENVAAFTELVKLSEHMEDRSAAKAFAAAFVQLQQDMPRIQAKKAVPNNDGTTRYVFAPYESIMEQVAPYLAKHGFTIAFSTRYDGPRVVKICTLMHAGGHSKSNEFAARIGSGPPKASEAQADGAAGTYAKRFALCDALNIVIDIDSDARAEGGTITAEQAKSLRERVRQTASDEAKFLAFALHGRPGTFEDITADMYEALDTNLRRKESTK
jgi:hypothetical protein